MATLTEKELKIKVKQRGTTRATVTKGISKLDTLLGEQPLDVRGAKALVQQLKEKKESLYLLDESILPCLDESELFADIERAEQYQDKITTAVSNFNDTLETMLSIPIASPGNPSPSPGRDVAPKLPKLEITKFNGDPLSWDEFWDNFSSSIHERQDLPTIDKFKYLKSFLEGEALGLADGYRLTNANYTEVVQALRERFGDPELATFSHFEALIALKPASYSLPELRGVFDKCESHIRSLVALGLPESTFGIVFTPLILSKLPKGVRIELHRKNGSAPWKLDNIRTLLKEEISAREKGEPIFATTSDSAAPQESSSVKPKPNYSPNKPMKPRSTTSTLTSSVRHPEISKTIAPSCVFCSGAHYSSSCSVYSDVDSRLKRAQGRCHCCLRAGHRAPQCRSKRPCYFCKRDTHHQSLCRNKIQTRSGESGGTLLTTTLQSRNSAGLSDVGSPAVVSLSFQTPQSNLFYKQP